ncbi:18989_t:CDS:2 [Entrophospora sp. SA101]|nr:18989_t:CDS:2 [Entrophospora sp. SA101]
MKEFKQLIDSVPIMLKFQDQKSYDHAILPVVTDELSVTLRLKLFDHSPNWTTIFHKGTEDLVRTPGLWANQAGNLHVRFSGYLNNNDGINKLACTLSLNKWYHISYTLSDFEKKLLLYINGELAGSYNIQQKVSFNNGPLYVGRSFNHGGFNGEVSNVCYFNWSLSAEEVKKWSEDKNKNDKEFKQLIDSIPIMLKIHDQQVFNHVDLPVVTDELSVTLRLKLFDHSPNWTTIFHKGTEDLVRTPGLWANQAGNLHVRFSGYLNNNDGINKLACTLSLNKWYHISYTLSDFEKKLLLYINGELAGSYNIQQKVSFNNGPLYVGRSFNHGGFNGEVSNVCYFNWSLSAEEVKKWSEDKNKNDKEFIAKLGEQHSEVLCIGNI